jgi:hypothetical protein
MTHGSGIREVLQTIAGWMVYTELAGAEAPPHTALIVVDMHGDCVSPGGATDHAGSDGGRLVLSSRRMSGQLGELIHR